MPTTLGGWLIAGGLGAILALGLLGLASLVFRRRSRFPGGDALAASPKRDGAAVADGGAETALRESEARLAMALSNAGLGLWDRDLRTGNLVFDRRWAEMLGYAETDIESHYTAWESLVHPDDLARVKAQVKDHQEGRVKRYECTYRLRTKSGGWRWILSQGEIVERDRDGNAVRIIGTHLDITQRRAIEQALRDSEARFRQLFETMLSGFSLHEVICDECGRPCDYRFLAVNSAFEKLTGLRSDELIGKTVLEVMPGTEPSWIEKFGAVALTGEAVQFEQYSRVLDRHFRVVAYSPEHGQFAVLSEDVTEQLHAEEERRKIEQGIQHTQKLESLGVLAGGIAHDFNNLLMGILGNANLATGELPEGSPVRRNVQEIETAAKRAADLCRQMLAYSGKGRFEIEPLNLNDIVQEITHLLEVSISKHAVLKYNLSHNLPIVAADGTQMRQIVMNLITNASESIGEQSGIIRVSTGAVECAREDLADAFPVGELEPGLYAFLEVADTGCGMTPEVRQRIFDPFFTTKFTGRGLGLAAVLGIVRGHKGSIEIDSEARRGTRFRVLLPADLAGTAETQDAPAPEEIGLGFEGKVLLVDDDETVRAVSRRMLTTMGLSVLTANDGREALAVFRANMDEISCVVLDLTMPHMDGEEAFGEIRKMKSDVPVLLSSGYSESDIQERFSGLGFAGFIHKPYDIVTLRSKLAAVPQEP